MIKIEHPTNRPNFTRVETGKATLWFSYATLVAFETPNSGLICSENVWSNTTGKHLNEIQPDKSKRMTHEYFLEEVNERGLG